MHFLSRQVGIALTVVSLTGFAMAGELGAETDPSAGREAVPSAAEQAKSEKVVHDLFKTDFANHELDGKRVFATKLLSQSNEASNELSTRYVLMRESRDTAASAGDFDGATEAAEAMNKSFRISLADAEEPAIELAVRAVSAPYDLEHVVLYGLNLAQASVASGEVAGANRLISVVRPAVARLHGVNLLPRINASSRNVEILRAELPNVRAAEKALAAMPDDPEANGIEGAFRCFVADDWARGLPMLAKGSDSTLRETAKADLAATDPASATAAVAARWDELATKEKSSLKSLRIFSRARDGYRRSLADLSGLEKVKVEKRLAEIDDEIAERSGQPIYVSDLKPSEKSIGFLVENTAIVVNGITSPHGVWMHPPNSGNSHLTYDLDGRMGTFAARVAINDTSAGSWSALTFKVIADGKLLWQSKPIQHIKDPQDCSMIVAGIHKLTLLVQCPGSNGNSHAVWFEPRLLR